MNDAIVMFRRCLLVACHFVGPLLFFTNLTRNPYITQISLVHSGLVLALASTFWIQSQRGTQWRIPRVPGLGLLSSFIAIWLLSWLRAYWLHPVFFRPAIIAEGARTAIFLIGVCASSYLVSAFIALEEDGSSDVSLSSWVIFTVVWGLLWAGFASARSHMIGRPDDFWGLVWDPYGAFLWIAGFIIAVRMTKRGRAVDFLHLTLCAGFLASAYGILQYFNMDWVWPYTLNPYGGRAVSTFGNPNFLSSFNVALMPIALAAFLSDKNAGRRFVYAALFLVLEAAMLATLTRSSWLGSVLGCLALLLSPAIRAKVRSEPKALGFLLSVAIGMALAWPSSAIATGYTPTVVGRLTEFSTLMKRDGSYSPFHQRVLIWTCAWLMGSESPLLGKGGGLFELFYPFYQGHLLHTFKFFHNMRTHANNSHNEILEIFSQSGILGLGLYLALWTSFFTCAWRWARGRIGSDPIWIGCVAGCAGVLVDNMLNVSLHFTVPAFLFWWIAGTAMGRGSQDGRKYYDFQWVGAYRRPILGLVIAGAVSVTWIQVRIWEREAWYFAGFKFARMGDVAASTRALERSRSWGPREVNALYELGNSYARIGHFHEAASSYRQALDANAGYDEIYYNLGTVYNTNLARPDLALDFYETSWAINPLSNDLINGLSAFYLRDPKVYLTRAIDMLQEAVKIFPDNPNHWNNLGYSLSLAHRWKEAESAYVRALSISPEMSLAEKNLFGLPNQSGLPRSPMLLVLGDLRLLDAKITQRDYSDTTLALAKSVTQRAPGIAKSNFLYGSLLLARSRPSEALQYLELAAKQYPDRAVAHVNLATAYQALGKLQEAQSHYRVALNLEPNNTVVRERLKSLPAMAE